VAPSDPLTPQAEQQALTVPAGFEVQLVAAEPQIDKPIQMAFDARGRLWVSTSRHYPFPAEAGQARDKVYILSDFDPQTGQARTIQTFAEDLNIPIGILPLPDGRSALISSCGEIRKYTDRDGDGRADGYEVLFRGFGFRDTHGMYNSFTLLPDGWVYACHGFANDSTVRGRDGHTVRMHSGHTFRFRPDGSRIEVFTFGQVNPFGIAIDPWDRLYTADCHSRPITQLIPQAYYDSFGKPHDGLGFGPHVTRHDHGSTALCGLVWYQADHFPAAWHGHMFLGNVVTNRINCDRITWNGSSPVAVEQPDFLVSRDRWFRPVDLKLGPDGALYVADFYNRIIGHYEVDLRHPGRDRERGRIWRIVWRGTAQAPAAPPRVPFRDLTAASQEELLRLAEHTNLTVRLLARVQLASRFPHVRLPRQVRWDSRTACRTLSGSQDPHQQRAAAEYLILHPSAEALPHLLDLLRTCPPQDTHLRHASRIALRNALRDTTTGWSVAARRLQEQPTDLPRLLDVLHGLPTRASADFLAKAWQDAGMTPQALQQRCHLSFEDYLRGVTFLARHASGDTLRSLAVLLQPELAGNSEATLRIARAFFQGRTGQNWEEVFFPAPLENLLRETLQPTQPAASQSLALEVLSLLRPMLPDGPRRQNLDRWASPSLTTLLGHTAVTPPLRQQAITLAVRDYAATTAPSLVPLLTAPATPPSLREHLMLTLAAQPQALNHPPLRSALREALKQAPYRLVHAVAVQLATSRPGAELLLQAAQQQELSPHLLQERLIRERVQAHRQPALDQQLTALTKNLPPLDQNVQNLIRQRTAAFGQHRPDLQAGARLFGQHCAPCHRLGSQGGTIAPQLDGIAARGPERLLEDILDPNRNVDPAFRARVILTTDERTLTGLVLPSEDPAVLLLADTTGQSLRIPKKEIVSERETLLSPMPSNFAQLLAEKDLYDLLAFLLQQQTPPKKP
jgi:putative heme-binding domain-containing protein